MTLPSSKAFVDLRRCSWCHPSKPQRWSPRPLQVGPRRFHHVTPLQIVSMVGLAKSKCLNRNSTPSSLPTSVSISTSININQYQHQFITISLHGSSTHGSTIVLRRADTRENTRTTGKEACPVLNTDLRGLDACHRVQRRSFHSCNVSRPAVELPGNRHYFARRFSYRAFLRAFLRAFIPGARSCSLLFLDVRSRVLWSWLVPSRWRHVMKGPAFVGAIAKYRGQYRVTPDHAAIVFIQNAMAIWCNSQFVTRFKMHVHPSGRPVQQLMAKFSGVIHACRL